MSPARPSVPAALRLLPLLPLLPLLLLPCPPAVRGDCGLPPQVPNALPALGGNTGFPENSTVTYKCNEGFVKVPGKPDSAICLPGNQWSEVAEFCNRSCDVPIRLLFASLKKDYSMQNYFPVGSTVEYECRPGYRRDLSKSVKLTCLENITWSKPAEFCKRKPCPNPGELRNGNINVTTDILYGSPIFFSCNTGYKLVGATSSYCSLSGNTVNWGPPLPECIEIHCPEPPKIDNGYIQEEHEVYVYRQSITYGCNKGFTLVGNSSIYCAIKDNEGEWSGPPPQCKGRSSDSKPLPTPQKPTTVSVPGTEAPPTPKKPSTVNIPATRAPPTPQKPTTVNAADTRAPTPQKHSTINAPATRAPPTPQKPTTVNAADTRAPTPQKHSTINAPATRAPQTPQKPTTVNAADTRAPTPQKHSTINAPATRAPPTPQKPTIVNATDTRAPPTPQKPTTVNVPDAEVPPPPQKPTIVNIPATRVPTHQKPTTVNVPASEATATSQKPTTLINSTTKTPATTQTSPISNALSTKTSPAAQKIIMANTSATQTTTTTQRVTTTKASFTQSFPATRKSTTLHVPVTQGLQSTKRFTSARITATQRTPVPKATTSFHATSTSKGKEMSPSDAVSLIYGFVAAAIIIGILILVKIFWDYGKSGSYNTHENNKALNVMFHNLSEADDTSEFRPSDKLQKGTHV